MLCDVHKAFQQKCPMQELPARAALLRMPHLTNQLHTCVTCMQEYCKNGSVFDIIRRAELELGQPGADTADTAELPVSAE